MAHRQLLEIYRESWGEPREEVLQVSSEDGGQSFYVAIHETDGPFARVATVGLGTILAEDGLLMAVELVMALDRAELHELDPERVELFLSNIGSHLLHHSIRPLAGSTIPATSIAPWGPDAVLFDTPRGEPEHLERFEADGVPRRLLWAIPVYREEARLVAQHGIEAFDALVSEHDVSLADVRRPNLLVG
jgi:hypothetical protein